MSGSYFGQLRPGDLVIIRRSIDNAKSIGQIEEIRRDNGIDVFWLTNGLQFIKRNGEGFDINHRTMKNGYYIERGVNFDS